MSFVRRNMEDRFISLFSAVFLGLTVVLTLYPFVNVLAISLNDPLDTVRGGIYLLPRVWTTYTYEKLLSDTSIYQAAMVSLSRTLLGGSLNLMVTIITAYLISRKEFVARRLFSFLLISTMYVHAGLIPGYLLIKEIGLVGSFWVYIIPGLVNAFNIIIVRTYIEGLPDSLVESARVFGAGELRILFQIVIPLILPVVAVVTIFVSIGHWNAWFDTYLYGAGKRHMVTLQYRLMEILMSAQLRTDGQSSGQAAANAIAASQSKTVSPASLRAAMTMLVTVPIMLVYPFLQKYFVQGLTLGGVKE